MTAEDFKRLFLPHARAMYRTAWQIVGNAQDAEDMVQEAFVRLWERRDVLPLPQNAEAYCVALVRNICIDCKRIRRIATIADEPDETMAATDNTGDIVEQRDLLQHARRAIERLPANQREVVTLHDLEGRSISEVRTITGLTEVNIRKLLSRAHQQIKQLLPQ